MAALPAAFFRVYSRIKKERMPIGSVLYLFSLATEGTDLSLPAFLVDTNKYLFFATLPFIFCSAV